MHYQAGIDWTKAARLAMGGAAQDADNVGNDELVERSRDDINVFPAVDTALRSQPSIKYPSTVGDRSRRDPERDSFLRGGHQFKSLQHRSRHEYTHHGIPSLS